MCGGRHAGVCKRDMSGNRFEFLELGEDDQTPQRPADAQGRASEPPLAGREPIAERGQEGEPLAQVRDVDTRGYRTFLHQEQDSEAVEAVRNRLRRAPGTLRAVEVFGERGGRAGQFNFPTGLALDRGGVLFVADSYNHRVQRVTPDGGVSPIGGRGHGRGQFLLPQGIATDRANAFYIIEQGNHRVQKYSSDGFLELVFGRLGTRDGEFQGPTGIAVAPNSGDIYVADAGNGRVQRFDASGNFLGLIGMAGPGHVSSFRPQTVAVDLADNLYVADPFANRVSRFDPLGRLAGQSSREFYQPRSLACGEDGMLFVADGGDGVSLEADARGRVLAWHVPQNRALATVEQPGRNLGSLSRPCGLAFGPASTDSAASGDLYVADTMNHRILRFLWE